MSFTTPDPITNDQSRVLVRQTATGFEQCIAGFAGLLTAGPLGAIAAFGAIRGLQGKWAPWTILGTVAAPVLLVGQLAVIGSFVEDDPQVQPTIRSTQAYKGALPEARRFTY